MDSDNYPNPGDNLQTSDLEGWTPPVDEEKKEADAKENAKLASSVGIVSDVMHWLETKKSQYEGTEIISGANPGSDAEAIKSAVLLNQGMCAEMKTLLRDFRIEYAKYIEAEPMR